MKNVLFICSVNKLRSPTAEHVFASWDDYEFMDPTLVRLLENKVGPFLR